MILTFIGGRIRRLVQLSQMLIHCLSFIPGFLQPF
jgi:hypothetical protein